MAIQRTRTIVHDLVNNVRAKQCFYNVQVTVTVRNYFDEFKPPTL